jgi:hypothetical protein
LDTVVLKMLEGHFKSQSQIHISIRNYQQAHNYSSKKETAVDKLMERVGKNARYGWKQVTGRQT